VATVGDAHRNRWPVLAARRVPPSGVEDAIDG